MKQCDKKEVHCDQSDQQYRFQVEPKEGEKHQKQRGDHTPAKNYRLDLPFIQYF